MTDVGRRALRAGQRAARRIAAEPRGLGRLSGEATFLAAAVLAQWIAVGLLAAAAAHNGWLYYQGGDQTYFYTTAWILSHGHLPATGIGYAWSLIEAPVAAVAGPSFVVALPGLIAIQVVLLLPLALVAFYGTAKRLLGAGVARLGVVAWVAAPFAVIPLFVGRYHTRWTDQTVPQLLGLSGMGDFAAMVCLLCAAYLLFRHLDEDGWETAALAGLVAGFAVGLKPSTTLFIAGPLVAFAIVRRYRGAIAFATGLAPAVLALAVWKYRGLGTLPIFSSYGTTELAAGLQTGFDHVATSGIAKYVDLNWHHLGQNLDGIREYFWSNRLVEWLPLAGALGAVRKSPAKGSFLAAWLAAYVVVKGTSSVSSVDTASFWRLLSPAWPAYLLLALSIVALVPTVGARIQPVTGPRRPHAFRRTLWVALVALGLLPLVIVTALPRDHAHRGLHDSARNLYVPIDRSFHADATVAGETVTVSWKAPPSGNSRTTFIVTRAVDTGLPDAGIQCFTQPVPVCLIAVIELGYATSPFVDRPGPGHWLYRVAQAASYTAAPGEGDPVVYSEPARVTVTPP